MNPLWREDQVVLSTIRVATLFCYGHQNILRN